MHARSIETPDRERWTVRLGAEGQVAQESVVLVPPMGDPWWTGFDRERNKVDRSLGRGFELVRPFVGKGRVRLIGRGATAADLWPAWVRDAQDLVLTEFDAYLPSSRSALLAELVAPTEAWIRDTLGDVLPDVHPGKAFWGSSSSRVLGPSFAAWPAVLGIAHHHARDHVVCGEPAWAGCAALEAALRAGGGDLTVVPDRGARVPFAVALAGETAASIAMSAVKRGLELWKERKGRRWLRDQRREGATPRVWMGVSAGAAFSCRHIVEGVASTIPQGVDVGVLLHASLDGGTGAPRPWPILDELAAACPGRVTKIDQCASVESWTDGAAAALRMAGVAVRAVSRVAARGERLQLGPMTVSLRPQARNLARFVTMDVLRAIEAAAATRALLRREAMRGSVVVWPHASLASVCAPDLLLQSAGARTVDLVHGMLSDPTMMLMFEQTFSSTKAVWTEAEARFCGPFSGARACQGGFVPRRLSSRAGIRPAGPARVLVTTNYLLDTQLEGPVIFETYQHALIDAVVHAAQRLGGRIELRWRPHPSESASRIALQLAKHPGLFAHVSRERGALQADLAWADVVVTSVSSAIVEALCHPVAIVVHEIPVYEKDGILASIRPERRFDSAGGLAPIVERIVDALERGDAAVHEPDVAARRALFGESMLPRSLSELLFPSRARDDGRPSHATSPPSS